MREFKWMGSKARAKARDRASASARASWLGADSAAAQKVRVKCAINKVALCQ